MHWSSPVILYQVNATDNTETVLMDIYFKLGGSVENINEVSWTITKHGMDKNVSLDKSTDAFMKSKFSY